MVTKRKPTAKQRRAVEIMVENGGNASKAMREAGYSPATAKNPQKLTHTEGFLKLADEVGLTDNFLLKALKDDIDAKPTDRKGELELAMKVKGKLINKTDITTKGESLNVPTEAKEGMVDRLKGMFHGEEENEKE